jgi:glycosyltransferase involved in cell wall biosynthesis
VPYFWVWELSWWGIGLRIGILTLSFLPIRAGMEYVVHDLARYLCMGGHEVYVFAPCLRGNDKETPHNYSLIRFGSPIPGAFRYGLNRLFLMYKVILLQRKKGLDIINVHSADLATTYALDLKRLLRIPVVVTCHGHDIQTLPEIGYGLRLEKAKDKAICRNLRRVDRIIAISGTMYDDILNIVPREKIALVPNGVQVPDRAPGKQLTLRKRLGIDSGIIVMSVGRNVPKKAFETGLRAFAEVAREVRDVFYVHFGGNSSPLVKLSAELGISDRFFAMGEVNRDLVLSGYEEADIFFSPAIIDSFGLVTFEAMFAGLPCVVSDGPGNREAVRHGVNGLIAAVGDYKAMAGAILELIRDGEKRKKYGKASVGIAASYNWSKVSLQYVSVFEDVLERRGK